MKKILILLIITTFISCKKEEKEKTNTLKVTCYSKANNGIFSFDGKFYDVKNTLSLTFEVSENKNDFSVVLKSNKKLSNDSLNLKVEYKGKTKQSGVSVYNTLNTLSYQLSSF